MAANQVETEKKCQIKLQLLDCSFGPRRRIASVTTTCEEALNMVSPGHRLRQMLQNRLYDFKVKPADMDQFVSVNPPFSSNLGDLENLLQSWRSLSGHQFHADGLDRAMAYEEYWQYSDQKWEDLFSDAFRRSGEQGKKDGEQAKKERVFSIASSWISSFFQKLKR